MELVFPYTIIAPHQRFTDHCRLQQTILHCNSCETALLYLPPYLCQPSILRNITSIRVYGDLWWPSMRNECVLADVPVARLHRSLTVPRTITFTTYNTIQVRPFHSYHSYVHKSASDSNYVSSLICSPIASIIINGLKRSPSRGPPPSKNRFFLPIPFGCFFYYCCRCCLEPYKMF